MSDGGRGSNRHLRAGYGHGGHSRGGGYGDGNKSRVSGNGGTSRNGYGHSYRGAHGDGAVGIHERSGGYSGYSPRGRGGNRNKADVKYSSIMLPQDVTLDAVASTSMGWDMSPLKLPANKGVGKKTHKTISIVVNHLESHIDLPLGGIYQYEVDIDLDDESKRKKKDRREKSKESGGLKIKKAKPPPSPPRGNCDPPKPALWKKLMLRAVFKIERREKGSTFIATDGKKVMYTAHPIGCIPSDGIIRIPVKVKELSEDETTDDCYIVSVTQVAVIRTDIVAQCINDTKAWLNRGLQLPADFVNIDRVYNIVLKTPSLQTHTAVGRASFFPTPSRDGYHLGGGLVNWSGYSLTYTMGWKPFVTVDLANSAFLLGSSVEDVLRKLFEGQDPMNVKNWRPSDFDNATSLLRTCKVSYVQANGQKLSRRVTGISKNIARENVFIDSDGLETNVEQYFKHDKKMPLKYEKGPCLLLGATAVVPAEFCVVEKGQVFRQKLSEAQTANMIKDTAKPPEERLRKIRSTIEERKFNSLDVLAQFGVSVAGQLTVLKHARILPPPTLIYGKSPVEQARLTPCGDGVWDIYNEKVQFVMPYKNGKLVHWAVLNLTSRYCIRDSARNFIRSMTNTAQSGGLNLGDVNDVMDRHYFEMDLRPPHSRAFNTWFNDKKRHNYDFILVIMPRKDTNMYSCIKKAAELDTRGGTLTQCVVANNVNKNQPATVGNVILKLNMKLGGVNNLLYFDDSMLSRIDVLRAPVMIMGADVTHPGRDSQFPSFAAVTASIDRTGMPYMMHTQAQRVAGQGAAEIITGLDVITKKMLTGFIETSGHRPRKIIVFRDGVGDSQFEEVLQKEMLMIRKGCKDLENDKAIMKKAFKDEALGDNGTPYQPKITFITVQKRHKTRFFPENPGRDGVGKPLNAPPGTVVDTQIVDVNTTNFYLLSHIGIQGTSRPTRYQVLWDDTGFSTDEIQLLTYYLCYCYCRCNRSVSYPAPTYYAHLAAYRAKIFAHNLGDVDLENVAQLNAKIERQPDLLRLHPMHFV